MKIVRSLPSLAQGRTSLLHNSLNLQVYGSIDPPFSLKTPWCRDLPEMDLSLSELRIFRHGLGCFMDDFSCMLSHPFSRFRARGVGADIDYLAGAVRVRIRVPWSCSVTDHVNEPLATVIMLLGCELLA